MKRTLVVFGGMEFRSVSLKVSKLLSSVNIPSIAIEQSQVRRTFQIEYSNYQQFVLVPLMYKVPNELLRDNHEKLKLIHQWGVGLEGVNQEEAKRLGILVANTPSTDFTARATAEQAVHLLLTCTRGVSKNIFKEWGGPRGSMLFNRRIGVVGHQGQVGSKVCSILRDGFGAHVIGIGNRNSKLEVELDKISGPTLDGLIITAPLTTETRGMVNRNVFKKLSKGAFLVNVGRGPLIDRSSLEEALSDDPELKFGSDVWFTEPPLVDDSLLSHPRVFLSPHIGGVTNEASEINDERCYEGIVDFVIKGKVPVHCVNISREKNASNKEIVHSNVRPTTLPRPSLIQIQRVLDELKSTFRSEQISTSASDLLRRGTDESLHDPVPPDVVFLPTSTEDISKAMKICSRHNFPVVPFGAGTSLEGSIAALAGGLTIDTSLMNSVLAIDADDFSCLVQAGVTRLQLAKELKPHGIFFPVDPGADATLGGMASTRASGTTAVRYGTMKERVSGLTVVLPSGEVIKTGGKTLKSSAGYDLTSLFVGAEGTLGIISEVQLKLSPVTESICSAVVQFKDVESAVNTVMDLKSFAVPIARAEFLDKVTMKAVRLAGFHHNSEQKEDYPSLFLEFQGTPAGVLEQCKLAKSLAKNMISFEESVEENIRSALWKARHNAYYSVMKLRPPGTKGWPTDVCVPVSKLTECIMKTLEDVENEKLIAPIFGHVGDGNFHCILLYNPSLDGEDGLLKLQQFNDRLVGRALKLNGTCTGEHGIGYGKKAWLPMEHGKEAVKFMQRLKQAVDPQNLMNPGKLF